MTTKHKNKGIGDGSGRWLMEEFLLEEGYWAKFVVSYQPEFFDMSLEPEWPTRWRFEASEPFVSWLECEVYDEAGNRIMKGFAVRSQSVERQVLKAFRDDIESVEIYERERR